MPVIFGLVLIALVIYFLVSMIIPTIATTVAASFIGNKAKLDFDRKFTLATYYYFITGAFVGLAIITQSEETGIGWHIFEFLMGFFLWPLPVSFLLFGVATDGGLEIVLSLLSAFAVTQMIAVIMILKRTKRDTDKV